MRSGLEVLRAGWNDSFLWLFTAGNFWGMPSQSGDLSSSMHAFWGMPTQSGDLSSSMHAFSRTLFASRRLAF